jgi:tetratricopeptide (TPR) repeat protein
VSEGTEETERRLQQLLSRIESLESAGRSVEVLRACLEAMSFTPLSDERRAALGLTMTRVAPDVSGETDLVQQTISSLEDLVGSGVLPAEEESSGRVHLALARLCTNRNSEGDSDRAAQHYLRAQDAFDRERYPEEWAAAQVGMGVALMSKIKTYRGSELRPGSVALEEAKRNLDAAIRAYQEAFWVYTEGEFPDDWQMTNNLISSCRRMAESLDRRG